MPTSYRCGECGASGCKLWREYQTFLVHLSLYCARCAAKAQKKDISDMDQEGSYTDPDGFRCDQIGWLVPAVPTQENDTFWGYTSVPQPGVMWWRGLPTFSG
jgi:hypothetical protein